MMRSLFLLLAVIVAAGCISTEASSNGTVAAGGVGIGGLALETVQANDSISVNYIGKLEDGAVFDTSYAEVAKNASIFIPQRQYEPLKFTVGAGQMIQGFDEGVLGMKKGEQKTLTIAPENAYGAIIPEAVVLVPLEILEKNNITAEVGMELQTISGTGKVTNVNGTHATIDFNHPLAGKTLVFDVKIETIEKPKAQ
jgi:FKBP-type peptidyl-prolyl cis-trans isomerase 2